MGGRWSICAKDVDDKLWKVCDYNCNLFQFIVKGIYCLFRYEVVELGKHG